MSNLEVDGLQQQKTTTAVATSISQEQEIELTKIQHQKTGKPLPGLMSLNVPCNTQMV